MDSFFDGWKDAPESFKLYVQLGALVAIFLLGIITVLRENVTAAQNASILFGMLSLTLLFAFVRWKFPDFGETGFFDFLSFGESLMNFAFAFALALGAGFIFSSFTAAIGLTVLAPLAVINTLDLTQKAAAFVFNVGLAPFVEEGFFRGFITPTFIVWAKDNQPQERIFLSIVMALFPALYGQWFIGIVLGIATFLFYTYVPIREENIRDLVSIVISGIPFGLFHLYAYGGGLDAVLRAVEFGTAMALGNYVFRSSGFGLGGHLANNFIQHLKTFGSLI